MLAVAQDAVVSASTGGTKLDHEWLDCVIVERLLGPAA